MAVNILSLGTFLLLDTSLTLEDRREAWLVMQSDTDRVYRHQDLIESLVVFGLLVQRLIENSSEWKMSVGEK